MPTEVILMGAALLILGAVMASRRAGNRRNTDSGIAGSATVDGGSSGADCADSGGGCGGGDGGGGAD
ncbi:hypothetical protein ACFPOA_00715 [Lysobacter niabensis]|uniref:hypothetical protein n=1 Tax=Agrilutibacter niabensis TaxID=380628 RepID=UPI00361575DF